MPHRSSCINAHQYDGLPAAGWHAQVKCGWHACSFGQACLWWRVAESTRSEFPIAFVRSSSNSTATSDTGGASYQYGLRDLETSSTGAIADYVYDGLGRLDKLIHYRPDSTPQALSNNLVNALFDFTWQPDGKLARLDEITSANGALLSALNAGSGNVATSYAWTYDAQGKLTREVIVSDPRTARSCGLLPESGGGTFSGTSGGEPRDGGPARRPAAE
ncbi:MAG: hypothetical protein IT428_11675 [Planctomycetaceae bacterium]|nr:hypothetical protein [Planctomycetaceae bacterium]